MLPRKGGKCGQVMGRCDIIILVHSVRGWQYWPSCRPSNFPTLPTQKECNHRFTNFGVHPLKIKIGRGGGKRKGEREALTYTLPLVGSALTHQATTP